MHGRNAEMNAHNTSPTKLADNTTSYLGRPGGRIGYDVAGQGPLVVLVPEAGHYAQSQQPDITTAAVLRFLAARKGTLR
jgi:hypothetical protein